MENEELEEIKRILKDELYRNNYGKVWDLLDMLLTKIFEDEGSNFVAIVSLQEYAKKVGEYDLTETRRRVKSDLEILKKIKYSYSKKKKNGQDYMNIYLFGGTEGIREGNIIFKFNEQFFKVILRQLVSNKK